MRQPLQALIVVLLATVLALAAGAGATQAVETQQQVVRLQIANPKPGPGGAIIPAGEIVTLLITVRPARLLIGHGGRFVVQVRGAKNVPGGPTTIEARVGQRLATRPNYRSTSSCRRTPCRLQVRSTTDGVWHFKAVLLDGTRVVDWSPDTVQVIWHSEPSAITLEGPGFTCTKRFPNSSVSGDRLSCSGTVKLPSKEEVRQVLNGEQVELTARVSPAIPEGWWLKVAEPGGRMICEVPRAHPSATNSCSGFIATANPPQFREDRAWPIDVALEEYAGLKGPGIGKWGSLHEVVIWWGCPPTERGKIPACP